MLQIGLGIVGVAWIWMSVIRTVVVPRPERVWLTSISFELARQATQRLTRRMSPINRHHLLGIFAPVVLITLPFVWSVGLVFSFAFIYWGLDIDSFTHAVELSGSSLTTLGFIPAPTFGTRIVAVLEALSGLAIVALMISFLPTLYATFSRREVAVGRLTTRAGEPPSPIEFIVRLKTINRLEQVGDRWREWEDWFVELGETHTTFPALIYFRSARLNRSWLSAAEMALDTAALISATKLIDDRGPADTMIRSGYLALRAVADSYRIEPELVPEQISLLSVSRRHFDDLLDGLSEAGIEIPASRDDAWADFAGWRVNYDRALTGLRALVSDVPSHWNPGEYDTGM